MDTNRCAAIKINVGKPAEEARYDGITVVRTNAKVTPLQGMHMLKTPEGAPDPFQRAHWRESALPWAASSSWHSGPDRPAGLLKRLARCRCPSPHIFSRISGQLLRAPFESLLMFPQPASLVVWPFPNPGGR
ncbi:MAG: hypothetical protein EOR21_29575 [Mesorhizobium sp.]|nr:MAG: hypothetical protein EOR21_29575 [Mesorhizobium sp.]